MVTILGWEIGWKGSVKMLGLLIYLGVGVFVAGAIAAEKAVKHGLSVPLTVTLWPVYVVIFIINELTD